MNGQINPKVRTPDPVKVYEALEGASDATIYHHVVTEALAHSLAHLHTHIVRLESSLKTLVAINGVSLAFLAYMTWRTLSG